MTGGIGFTILQCMMNMIKVNLSIQSVFSVLKSVVYFSILVIFTGFAIQVSSLHASEPLVSEEQISYPPPPGDKTQLPQPVQQYIQDIEGLCNLKSFEEQVSQLEQALDGLDKALLFYIYHHHRKVDPLRLSYLHNSLFGYIIGALWDNVIEDHERIDMAREFLFNRIHMYNLPDSSGPETFTHDWEHKIYRGLHCFSKAYTSLE